MDKMTNTEKQEIAMIVKSEGWLILKKIAQVIASTTQQELYNADATNPDRMLSMAHKAKWTAAALSTYLDTLENIKNSLDKEA